MDQFDEKRAFARNEGFVLAVDMGHKVMAAASELPDLEKICLLSGFGQELSSTLPDSVISLYLVSSNLRNTVDEAFKPHDVSLIAGVSGAEMGRTRFRFESGLGDSDFIWHFAPVIAHEICQNFYTSGMLSKDQYAGLTLGDWADVIGSVWFSEVMHDLALTANGIYGNIGRKSKDITTNPLRNRLLTRGRTDEDMQLFDLGYSREEEWGETYLTAHLTPEFRQTLRAMMRDHHYGVGTGCPVARHAGALSLERLSDDSKRRLEDLVTENTLQVTGRSDTKMTFRHDYTPIDRGLDCLAAQLDQYDQDYGTPTIQVDQSGQKTIVHKKLPKTGALIITD